MCVICLPPEKSSNRSIYGPVSVLLFGLECVCTSFPLVVVQCSWCLLQTVSPLSLCCRAADSVVMHVDLLCCVLSSPPPTVSTCTTCFLVWKKEAWRPTGLPSCRTSIWPCLQRYGEPPKLLCGVGSPLPESTQFCS